jgi:urease accessory protein
MTIDSFLSILQFSDGLFPAGAYAHSFGLEYYVQNQSVKDAGGVFEFIRSSFEGSIATTDLIVMLSAHRCAARNGGLDELLSLDAMVEAMKPAEELRSASRQMGRQMIRIAAALSDHALLKSYFLATESDSTAGHHSVCYGAIGGTQEWSEHDAASAFLYSAASAMAGAALRLLPLGQLRGQQLLWQMRPVIARLARDAMEKTAADIHSFVPGLEIASMRHAQLEARLFRS